MIWMHFLVCRRVEANFATQIKRDRCRNAAPGAAKNNQTTLDDLSNAQADTIWSGEY